jgi:hypothetical protein
VYFLLGAGLYWLQHPRLSIANPTTQGSAHVTILDSTGAGRFEVSGVSSNIATRNDMRLYVLVHPVEPYAGGWWIQHPANVSRNGKWTSEVWIGSDEFPPHDGDVVEIIAVVAWPESVLGRMHVDSPSQLDPDEITDIQRFTLMLEP